MQNRLPWGLTSREGGKSPKASIVKEGHLGGLISSLPRADKTDTGREERGREEGRLGESLLWGERSYEDSRKVLKQGRQEKGQRGSQAEKDRMP